MAQRSAYLLLMLALGAAEGAAAKRTLMGASDHKYTQGDAIMLYANKVGPFQNPTETYRYYSLPFCQPKNVNNYKPEFLGKVLEVYRLVPTPFKIQFRTDVEDAVLCRKSLTSVDLKKFRDAIKQDYYFQMFVDDLPMWGFIGTEQRDFHQGTRKYFLSTHFHFDFSYNDDRVVEITASSNPMRTADVTTTENLNVQFSYSVKWRQSPITFDHRIDRFVQFAYFPGHLKIHWSGIINSCVTALLLSGILATILLQLRKKDVIMHLCSQHVGAEQEEAGLKYMNSKVFCRPPQSNLFSAMMGVGAQILAMAMCIFALALVGAFYPYNRGGLLSACVVLYALTAGISGYVSGLLYKVFSGTKWLSNVLLCVVLSCGPVLVVFFCSNAVATYYRSTAALPLGIMAIIILVWALTVLPLTVLGGICAKHVNVEFKASCRTADFDQQGVPPPLPWYCATVPQMLLALMAGFLPFSTLYHELYYVLASIWGFKVFTIYWVLFIASVLLITVTALTTATLTCFQLAIKNHRWWWYSFLCGGSTGIYVYGYCLHYYCMRSDMNSFLQLSFFFGYNAIICYALFLMLGTVGFGASLLLAWHIIRVVSNVRQVEQKPLTESVPCSGADQPGLNPANQCVSGLPPTAQTDASGLHGQQV